MVTTRYQIDPQRVFRNAVRRAQAQVGDLTIPLRVIARDFYRSQKGLFTKTGAGGYQDLTPGYKRAKRREVGFVYPILVKSRALERSVTNENDSNAVHQIVNRSAIIFGSRLSYAAAVQAKRPYMFIGPEQPKIATSDQMGRLERWVRILNDHVVSVLDGGRRAA